MLRVGEVGLSLKHTTVGLQVHSRFSLTNLGKGETANTLPGNPASLNRCKSFGHDDLLVRFLMDTGGRSLLPPPGVKRKSRISLVTQIVYLALADVLYNLELVTPSETSFWAQGMCTWGGVGDPGHHQLLQVLSPRRGLQVSPLLTTVMRRASPNSTGSSTQYDIPSCFAE